GRADARHRPRRRIAHRARGRRRHRAHRLAHRPDPVGTCCRATHSVAGHGRRRAGGDRRGELADGRAGPRPALAVRPGRGALRHPHSRRPGRARGDHRHARRIRGRRAHPPSRHRGHRPALRQLGARGGRGGTGRAHLSRPAPARRLRPPEHSDAFQEIEVSETSTSRPLLPDGWDLTDPELWGRRRPVEEFALLRRTAPVWWNAQSDEDSGGFHDGGYWVVSKLADIKEVSRKPEIFSSRLKGSIIRLPGDISPAQMNETGALLLNMDPPKHSKIRRIISKGFTPRAVESLRAALTDRAERIVHEAEKSGSGDFVEQVACELPLQAIAELLGVPQEDRRKLFDWSNQMLNYDDPEYGDPAMASAEVLG